MTVATATGRAIRWPCVLAAPHTRLRCTTTPGIGQLQSVTVAVLAQVAVYSLANNAAFTYSGPTVSLLTPDTWSTDPTPQLVTVTGTGFGPASWSGEVTVTVTLTPSPSCRLDNGSDVVVIPAIVTVVDDGTLTFLAPLVHQAAAASVVLNVAGQVRDRNSVSLCTGP